MDHSSFSMAELESVRMQISFSNYSLSLQFDFRREEAIVIDTFRHFILELKLYRIDPERTQGWKMKRRY